MEQRNASEEIDINYLFRKFKDFLKGIIRALFSILSFFIKFWIIVVILILIGVALGFYKDNVANKIYNNEGIVIPNYGSVDYLYSSIEEINNSISSSDTIFLKSIMGSDYVGLKGITIEPIADIYNTMTKSREQIDVFRILYQNQDLDKFIENLANSKYFKYHKINFTVEGDGISEKIIPELLGYFNKNKHFNGYQSIYKENAEFQMKEYKNMFTQIDTVLASMSKSFLRNQNPGVIISDNNLSSLFQRKQEMLEEYLDAQVRLSDYSEPVKLVFMNYDIKQSSLSRKIKYPILLVGLFAFIFFIRFLYIRMKLIAES